METNKEKENVWILEQVEEIRECGYGSVIFKIHENKVCDVEKRKKERPDIRQKDNSVV